MLLSHAEGDRAQCTSQNIGEQHNNIIAEEYGIKKNPVCPVVCRFVLRQTAQLTRRTRRITIITGRYTRDTEGHQRCRMPPSFQLML